VRNGIFFGKTDYTGFSGTDYNPARPIKIQSGNYKVVSEIGFTETIISPALEVMQRDRSI
jgi:hypothetical protein